jgi:TBC1 domain family member 10
MSLPWSTVLRVWDMFMYDGPKALFRAGLAILIQRKSYIIKKCPTQSEIVPYLLSLPKEYTQPDKFIEACLDIKIGHGELEKIRRQVKKAHESLNSADNL